MPRQIPLSPQDFHILVALAAGDTHGYAIMQDVAERTGGNLKLSPGTLYSSIKRMLETGLIVELNSKQRPKRAHKPLGSATDKRGTSADLADDERRRYYRLTPTGRKAAEHEADRMAEALKGARSYGLATKRG